MEFTQGAPFDSFGLSEATMRAIRNKGYEISTPVQAGALSQFADSHAFPRMRKILDTVATTGFLMLLVKETFLFAP